MRKRETNAAAVAGSALLAAVLAAAAVQADVRLPAVFGDHMVLQRDQPIPVWGWADPGEQVSITLDRAQTRTLAGPDGRWRAQLPAQPAGGPTSLVVQGANRLVFADVLLGEVWLASGQSNMEWPLTAAADSAVEVAAANWPQIRLFDVGHRVAFAPQDDLTGAWQVCTPQTAAPFSAVAYFFGRHLQRELDVPVGLIKSSWGGTISETWTDRGSLEAAGLEAAQLAAVDQAGARLPELLAAQRAATEAVAQALTDDRPAAPDLADQDWATMSCPTQWEQAGLPGFDGLVWFRRTVSIPPGLAGEDLVLRLGPVDEIDDTFFNGVRIGGLGSFAEGVVDYWDDPREYRIPGRLVLAGDNVLAVRVVDTKGAGGLWGGAPEAMMLEPAAGALSSGDRVPLAGLWRYRPGPRLEAVPSIQDPNQPTVLFNGMIHPLLGFGLRGVIWYQGESNLVQGFGYEQRMRLLIDGWRRLWGVGAFPFYYVQVAPFHYGPYGFDPGLLPRLWEAQRRVLAVPNTGMAVTTDLGNLADIHPRQKQEVGRRLALWALANTYGRACPAYSGPLVVEAAAEAGALRLRFAATGTGLVARDGGPLTWFEVAGADSVFRPAAARVDGTTIVLTSDEVTAPVQARFAWSEDASPNLVNREGLPASPFWIQAK